MSAPTPTLDDRMTINGYPILRAHRFPKRRGEQHNRLIMVDLSTTNHVEYVTAVLCDNNRSWLWGHYCKSLREASIDFDARVARGY